MNKHENDQESYDLISVMELLKSQQVPSELKPMKQVSYSAIHMFAASNLANTQILAKHFQEFNQLKQTVNDLNQSLKHQQSKIESQDEIIHTLKSEIHKLSTSKQEQIHNKSPKSANKSDIINSQLTEQFINLQTVIHAHGKKISELIKRYKKDHAQLNNMKKQISEINLVDKSANNSDEKETTTQKINDIDESLKSLKNLTDKRLNEMKSDLAGHEMEHEGIINEIINQMDNMKTQIDTKFESISNVLSNHNDNKPEGLNSEIIQDILTKNAKIIHDEMKKMVNNKLNKVEKIMSKLVNDMHKVRKHKNNNINHGVNNVNNKSVLRPNTANNTTTASHHHHHTIISVDLENVNNESRRRTSENVKIISTPNEMIPNPGPRKRRIRSSSFDPSSMARDTRK